MRLAVVLATVTLASSPARAAEPGECRTVAVDFQPASRGDVPPANDPPPQIVMWVEDTAGRYVTTAFVTDDIGRRGLGNRPGRFDFNSGPLWPYGRRTTTFPVWAHRHGMSFGTVVFQDGNDHNLSHSVEQSSLDLHYCRPMQPVEPAWDALSCASPNHVFTDKGVLDMWRPSLYPPRSDHARDPNRDSVSVVKFKDNPFDAVSHATPPLDIQAQFTWIVPPELPDGDYVLFVEVAKEFDHNATYSRDAYPSPTGIPWADYGEPYRGQPSVVYRLPFTISDFDLVTQSAAYIGYGDPDGLDGTLRAPDGTITTDRPGSGASRLALLSDGDGDPFRLRARTHLERDPIVPGAPSSPLVRAVTSSAARIEFIAPGDDDLEGRVARYDVRYAIGTEMTEETFETAMRFTDQPISPQLPGATEAFILTRLLPETTYSVGIRAYDDCHNPSALTVVELTTGSRAAGEVEWCFIATAAYGSPLAAEVERLRGFRDRVLRQTVLGELAVEAYYTFSPAVAGMVGESELLRATARGMLAPIVRLAK